MNESIYTRIKQQRAVTIMRLLCMAAAALLPASLSCGGKSAPKGDLMVTSFAPEDTSSGADPLQIQFDKPVVEDDAIGDVIESPPVSVEPAVEVAAYWADRQTLVITPQGEMRPSTRYQITLTGDLGKRTGGFSYSFIYRPLVVEGIWGVDINLIPPEPLLPIHFNQPVSAGDVAKHCSLQEKGGATIALTVEKPDEIGEQISAKPTAKLKQDTAYELICSELKGAGGNAALTAPYVLALHTYPPFSIQSFEPSDHSDDVPADDLEIAFEFATPVSLEEIRKHISAKPAIAGLEQGFLDRSGMRYAIVATLKATTTYKIEIGAELADTFGQALGKPFSMSFTTGQARPRLSLETGIYAVEPASPGYPVWTRNVGKFQVECASVPKERVTGLLTSELDYDPWYDAGSAQQLDWQELGLAKKVTTVAIDKPKDNWHLSNLALHEMCGKAGSNRGLFLAEIQSEEIQQDEDRPWNYRPYRRVLANVTNLGILLKVGTASSLVWVAQIANGEPVGGANVTVYSPQGKVVHRGRTDASGILRMPGTTQLLKQPGAGDKDEVEDGEGLYYNEYDSHRSQRLIVVVDNAEDLAVVDGNWANGLQLWNFGVSTDRQSGQTRMRGFIQSDRGIYRPGETVYFKGLVREIGVGQQPVVPKQKRIAIHVEDSRGQSVLDENVPISRFGGFAFELPLTTEASVGDYFVTATIDKQNFRERFSVEEFRKVSFEIDLKGADRHGRIGDKLNFTATADYLFGAPVVGAQVDWNVQRRNHSLFFPKYIQYTFSDQGGRNWWYSYDSYDYDGGYGGNTAFVADGSGVTDRRGRYEFSVRDSARDHDGPQDYVVGVTIRDETDQAVSKRTVVTAHKSDFYVGLHAQEYVQAVDMPFAINVIALSPEGERVGTKATLRFIRESYDCTWSEGFRSYQSCSEKHEVAEERQIDIPATGTGTERIMPKQPGEYIVRVETQDSRGNKVVASESIWVIGRGEAFWSGDESDRMALITSKESYQPGEVAKLVPRTGLTNATALVTIERNGIIDAFVKPLKSGADGIEISLKDSYAPNVFASVAMVTGRSGEGDRNRPRFHMGITELKVSPDAQRLKVEVTAEKESYEPGEEVRGKIRVTGTNGAPVTAEVSVSVADEGVLQLIAYKTPDPMNSFYSSWGLGVDPATNWNRIARLNDPSVGDPDMGGDGGGEGDQDDSVRSNFVSSAFWAPSLMTDANGEVAFTFKAPDNLTAFRMMAVAADEGSRFGSSDSRITIKKPLLAKPALPRFFNSGDSATVGVIVHNYTGSAGAVTVRATAKGLSLSKGEQTVNVEQDGSTRVNFPVKVGDGREATFEFSVAMGNYRDALQLSVPINQPLNIEHKTLLAGIAGQSGADTITTPVSWDSTVVANRSMLTVTVDRLGLSELEPSLRYLIEYPYGCLEQTLSRFIPLTKVADLASSLSMDELKGPKLKTFIRAGVAKVARHQHADGHFSLWPSGQTYPHLTVYALYGLLEAKRAKIAVPQEVLGNGTRALQSWVSSGQLKPGGELATGAMAAYVLAELDKPDSGLNDKLFAARAGLPRYGQAFLLRAMKRGGARAQDIDTLKNELLGAVRAEGDAMIVSENNAEELEYYMNSDVRSSAITLSALLEVDPQNAAIDKLVSGLKKKQNRGGYWSNTQDNLYSLVALSDYARTKADGSEQITLTVNGKQELRRQLKGADTLVFRRALHNYKPGEIKIETSGKAYYSVRLTEASKITGDQPVAQGFEVTREYVDPNTEAAVSAFKTGQLVKVRLTAKTERGRRYIALEDRLPAGFEVVNTRLATESDTAGAEITRSWAWDHIELRDDRVQAFADQPSYDEKLHLEYLVRATTQGTFMAPPAHAEEMYTPEVYGRSTAATIVVKK